MDYQIDDAIAILERTPETLRAMLSGLPESWLHNNEGGESWSPFEVVGHLLYSEDVLWITRANLILEKGESEAFLPFDPFKHLEIHKDTALDELLDKFTEARQERIAELKALNLNAEKLELRGSHPALGAVKLRELLATWVVHDLNHIHQIAHTMAKQYREAIGPWQEYLGVVNV